MGVVIGLCALVLALIAATCLDEWETGRRESERERDRPLDPW